MGHLEIVKAITKVVLDKNPSDAHDYTPFHLAAEYGHLPVVEYLLQYVNNVDIRTDEYWDKATPLIRTSKQGHLHVIKFLVEKGADLELTDSDNWTPLMYAAYGGQLDVAKYLMEEEGANPKLKDSRNKTAHDFALEYGHSEVAEYLEQFN